MKQDFQTPEYFPTDSIFDKFFGKPEIPTFNEGT